MAVEGCYFVWGNVIEVEELRQRNRRELLLLEEEQGCFPRRLVLLCLLCNRTSAAQLNTVAPSGVDGACSADRVLADIPHPVCLFLFRDSCDFFSFL